MGVFFFKTRRADVFHRPMPAQLELSEVVLIDTVFSGACGIAIFRLSDTTLSRINSEGKSFFVNASTARAPRRGSHGWHPTYEGWESTPVPKNWTSEGSRSWMSCASPNEVVMALVDAALSKESYYTQDDRTNSKLLVAPALGLVVYSFFD
jgi:hypothetical protein